MTEIYYLSFNLKKEPLDQKVSKHLTFCFNPALDF